MEIQLQDAPLGGFPITPTKLTLFAVAGIAALIWSSSICIEAKEQFRELQCDQSLKEACLVYNQRLKSCSIFEVTQGGRAAIIGAFAAAYFYILMNLTGDGVLELYSQLRAIEALM